MKLYSYYVKKLGKIPLFLDRYLYTPCLLRLKKVNYFCGMDNASKEIYNFEEKITRFDHSLSTALLTWYLTQNVEATLAALFHDAGTPVFSHVIDYMNKDYTKQESTEQELERILRNDLYLNNLLKKDKINIDNIINFKKHTIVDNDRPKLCADRIDGIILVGISWSKNISKEDIDSIIDNLEIYTNEDNEKEIGFKDEKVARMVYEASEVMNSFTHSNRDIYMMELLAGITKTAIEDKLLTYEDLYKYNEDEIMKIFKKSKNEDLLKRLEKFKTMTEKDIEEMDNTNVKKRNINPLVNGKRLLKGGK